MVKPWYSEVLKRGDAALRAQVAKALLETHKPKPVDRTGCIVEFLRGRRHRCGVVRMCSSRSRSMWILDQEDRETLISHTKIVDVSSEKIASQQRGEIIRALRQIDRHRESLKQQLEVRILWEIASEEQSGKWTLDELAELYFGEATDNDARAALARSLDEGRFFNRQEMRFTALPPAVVERRDRAAARRLQEQQRMEEAAAWLRQVADGETPARPEGAEEAIALLEQVALFGAESERASQAAELMKRAHLHGPLAAFEVLVKLGHWDAGENIAFRRCEAPVAFSSEALDEAAKAQWLPASRRRRWWGVHVYGFAWEGLECEQAFSVRRTWSGYKVGIYFASPALLLQRHGQVQSDALERGASMHLPDGIIPMLPPSVHAASSLTSQEHRPALAVEVRFDRRFQFQGVEIGQRRVRLRQVLSWDRADTCLAEDKHLRWLHVLARTLRQERRQAGTLILTEPELHLAAVDETGRIELQRLQADVASHLIWGELTTLARTLVGQFCVRQGVPALYRVEPVAAEKLIAGDHFDPVLVHEQKKHLPRATLQTEPEAGAAPLACINQPFHCCEDLLVHQQLLGFIERGTLEYTREELERSLADTAWAREANAKVVRSARRYWLLKYLEEKAGEEVKGVVLERAGTGLLLELDECGFKAFLPGGREVWAAPGDRIWVRLAQVSARRDLIHIERPQPVKR